VPTGPLGGPRLTDIGPFSYDETSPPKAPEDFTPPQITNSFGDRDWWKDWAGRDPRKNTGSIMTKTTDGAVILYDTSRDWLFIDNQSIFSDHSMQTLTMDSVDSFMDIEEIERESDADSPKISDTVASKLLFFDRGHGIEPRLDIPTPGGTVSAPNELIKKPDIMSVYKIVYPMNIIGVPENTVVDLEHDASIGVRDRTVRLKDMYKELEIIDQLPKRKVSRK
jgi:hypothetical protein